MTLFPIKASRWLALGLFVWGFFPEASFAYEPVAPWMCRPFQTQDGLPDNSVTGIAQTSDGYLWIATRGGLMRFNGQRFIPLPQKNLPPLPSRTVRAMLRDPRDQLWLGMERGPLLCVKRDGLEIFSAQEGLSSDRVLTMAGDAQGAVWIAYPKQLRRVINGNVEKVDWPVGWAEDLVHIFITQDFHGGIWYARGANIGLWRDGAWTNVLKFDSPITAVCGGGSTNLWVAVGDQLFTFSEGRAPVVATKLPPDLSPRNLMEDKNGTIWIGSASGGLFHWAGQELKAVPTSHPQINCLFQDQEENIWAGTEGGGLNLIRPRIAAVLDRTDGLPVNSIQSVTEDTHGNMWAVSDGQLACAIDGEWKILAARTDWPGENSRCVAADASGGVWVGTATRGLFHFDGESWQQFYSRGVFGTDGIRSLLVATNGDVWVAAGLPNRLSRVRDGTVTPLTNPQTLGPIRALTQDDAGTIWAGTSEGQVLRVEPGTLKLESVLADNLLSVRCLLATKGGHLWIGYAGDGLEHFKDEKHQRLTTANGLADDFVSQLLADDRGTIWINGNLGLSRVAISELEAVLDGRTSHVNSDNYGKLDGLPAMQPNRDFCPSAFYARDGHLWFALHGGLLAVQPERVKKNFFPPPVLIERVTLDESVVAAYNVDSSMQPSRMTNCVELNNPKRTLPIAPGHRKLQIDFAAMSFASPENIQLRYRLKPFDADWVDAGQTWHADYPHLPVGEYEFQVIARNNTGVWNEQGAKLSLSVAPFFWEMWWFKISGGVVTVLLGGAIAYWISRRRYREKIRRLEARRALEQERSRIARDIHDDLGANLTRISLLSQHPRGRVLNPESTAETLAQIHETARGLTHAMGEVVWAVNPEHDKFDSLANYASDYAQNFLRASGVRCRIEMPLQLPSRPLSAEIRHNLFLAFKEALNNVVKHSGATEVRVVLTPGETEFELLVADNGKGFARVGDPAKVQDEPGAYPSSGNGLANMSTRMREIGGECVIVSEPAGGTRIVFRVKLKPAHDQK